MKKVSKKPLVTFVVGITLSVAFSTLTFFYLLDQNHKKDELLFQKIIENTELAFDQYLHPLQGIASTLHYANLSASAKKFRIAAQSRNMFKNFKGAIGFGFIRRVLKEDVSAYVKSRRKENPDFALRRIEQSPDKSPYLSIIEFVEPYERNKKAVGLVISDDATRRQGAQRALITGKPQITQSIQLVQVESKEPGFLFYLPIYKTPTIPSTPIEREKNFFGWAYTPLLAKEIINFILEQNRNTLPFTIHEFQSDQNKKVLYYDPSFDINVPFGSHLQRVIDVGGQYWVISAKSRKMDIISIFLDSLFVFIGLAFISVFSVYYVRSSQIEFANQQKDLERTRNEVAQATKVIREQSDFLQTVINNIPAMIGYWDKNLINRLSNYMYEDFFNTKPSVVYGKHISELLTPELYQKNFPYFQRALKGESVEFEREMTNIRGERRMMFVKYHPHFENKEVVGFNVIVMDITHIRELEEKNKETQALLFSKSKLSILGEMAGGIAHEINNPLAIITGNASLIRRQLAKDTVTPEEIRKALSYLEAIQGTSDRIAAIIKGLRTFSRDTDCPAFLLTGLLTQAFKG